MSDKIVKVKLSAEVHDSFRAWAFNARTSMQAELSDHVNEVIGSSAPARSSKPLPAAQKQAPVKPEPSVVTTGGLVKPTPPRTVGSPVEYDVEPVKHQCAICRVSFPELEMTYHPKTMKWACKDCVDNQRNGQ